MRYPAKSRTQRNTVRKRANMMRMGSGSPLESSAGGILVLFSLDSIFSLFFVEG